MQDKNGIEIKLGDVVKIEGAYFKKNNGYWFVEHSAEDTLWSGDDCSLRKMSKSGKLSVTEEICFWPLTYFCSSSQKNHDARRHDRNHATIEIVHNISTCYVSQHFAERADKMNEMGEFYQRKLMETESKKYFDAAEIYKAVSEQTKSDMPNPKEDKSGLRFYYNGVKVDDGRLIPCWYHIDDNLGTMNVTITAQNYSSRLPNHYFAVINGSDGREDYFETDRAIITVDNPLYRYAFYAACQYLVKGAKKSMVYANKHLATSSCKGYYEQQIARAEETINKYSDTVNPGQPCKADYEALQAFRESEYNRKQEEEKAAQEAREQAVRREIEAGREFIMRAMEQYPMVDGEPVVTFEWSENPAFYAWEEGELKMSLAAADMILKRYDTEETRGAGGYDKTEISISYVNPWSGDSIRISNRYYLGDMRYKGIESWIKDMADNNAQVNYLNWMLMRSTQTIGD